MNRILAAALLLTAPFTAFAAPSSEGPMIHPRAPLNEVTGKVQVLYPRCGPGCPPVVRVQNGDAGYVTITGNLALDVAAFDGKVLTVKGDAGSNGSLDANGFAPGTSNQFVTGTVELVSPNCPANARCAQKVYLDVGNRKILVKDGFQYGLTGLEGATVTIRGNLVQYRCAPGTRCLGSEPTLVVEEGKNILVRGRIEALAHGMNGQTHLATLDNGETLLVSGKKWADRNFNTVWMSGKMTTERISGTPMFKATSASAGVPVVAAIEPFPMRGLGDGANVTRDAGTTGGVGATNAPAAGGAEAAGMSRN